MVVDYDKITLMDYISVEQKGTDLILTGIKNFIPAQILDCGQCFRWLSSNNSYIGITHGRRLEITLETGRVDKLILKNVTRDEFETIWCDYFDLGRDYGELRRIYAADATLNEAITFSPGLRLIRQDPWEVLVTFILSQNSNIPRIKGMVARLCEIFGAAVPGGNSTGGGFSFPTPEALATLSADDLSAVKCGYRDKYIIDAARRVAEGRLNLENLQNKPSEDVRRALMEVSGVGPKVADCVLLYGFGRVERYPLDVWMKRVMAKYYPEGFPRELEDTAGIAQQFLFHYARSNA